MRIIIDSNVIISAILVPRAFPSQTVKTARREGLILISKETIEEVREVISREKFNKYLSFEARKNILDKIEKKALMVDVLENIEVCRDLKDNKFLELGVSGNADYIVTGDKDLLVLHPFRGIQIVTPEQFLKNFLGKN